MSTRAAVAAVLTAVAAEQSRALAPLSEDLQLIDCGLDSLSFALVVAKLEDLLGVDPFSSAEWTDFPVTFADFVRLYDEALA